MDKIKIDLLIDEIIQDRDCTIDIARNLGLIKKEIDESIPMQLPVGVPSRNFVCEPHELMKTGGVWLGAVRTYIQSHFIDGDRMCWSSKEELRPHITMDQLQEIAAVVAASVYKEVSKL